MFFHSLSDELCVRQLCADRKHIVSERCEKLKRIMWQLIGSTRSPKMMQNLFLGVKDPHEKQKSSFVRDICRNNQLICWWSLWSFYTFGSAEYFTYSYRQSVVQWLQMQIRLFNQTKPFFSFCCSVSRLFCPLIKHLFSRKIPVYIRCSSLSNSMERHYSLVKTWWDRRELEAKTQNFGR